MNKSAKKSINKRELICIELLNSFTETELEQFNHFIKCPYFNTDKTVVRLFEALNKTILHKKSFDEAAQNNIYLQIFDEAKESDVLDQKAKKHLNAKLSLLKKLAEQFLSVEGLKMESKHYYDILFNKLFDKKQYRLFERLVHQNEKKFKVKKRDLNFYELKKVFEIYKLEYSIRNGSIYNNKEDNMYELNYNMDVAYLLNKINYYTALLTIKKITKKEYEPSMLNSIENILNLKGFSESPQIMIGKATIKLIKHQNKKYFNELLYLLRVHFIDLTKEDLNNYYNVATNFCIGQLREGKMDYSNIFDLYLEMDSQNVIIEDEYVPVLKLKNIIAVACRIGAFAKAKSLTEKYRLFIRKIDQENVCNFNYGVIAFYQKNYNEALKYFIRADLGQDANLKVMILKCHYEMDQDYDERTMQIFRSAQKFFKDNKKLTVVRKRSYRNFIQILIYIYKIKHMETKMQLSRAKEKLDAQDVNSDKEWLYGKMKDLE